MISITNFMDYKLMHAVRRNCRTSNRRREQLPLRLAVVIERYYMSSRSRRSDGGGPAGSTHIAAIGFISTLAPAGSSDSFICGEIVCLPFFLPLRVPLLACRAPQ